MAATEIEWATDVWNFVRGCRRVSPGCGGAKGVGGCYAEGQANRFKGPGQPYEGLVQLTKQGPRWTGVGRFVPEKLAEPLRARPLRNGERRRWFVNSMSDLFFEEFSFEQIAAGFGVMAACPHDDFLILTKRIERALEFFSFHGGDYRSNVCWWINEAIYKLPAGLTHGIRLRIPDTFYSGEPLPNVWLGCSAEDQQRADERVPVLLQCPAIIRFLSLEPLLGPIDLTHIDAEFAAHPDYYVVDALTGRHRDMGRPCADVPRVDWVIVGGESGAGARHCDVQWIRSIVRQCKAAGTACFVKQLGATIRVPNGEPIGDVQTGWTPYARSCISDDNLVRLTDRKGGDMDEWPFDLRVRQFPEARP